MSIKRYQKNPILIKEDVPFPVNSIFTSTASLLTRNSAFAVVYDSGPTLTEVDYTGALVKIFICSCTKQ